MGIGRSRIGWGALAWLALLCACAEGEDDSTPQESFCEAYCDTYVRCDPIDPYLCARWCVTETDRLVQNINQQAVTLATECLPTRPCAEVTTGDFVEVCLEAAEPSLEPTPTVVDFCQQMSPTWFECGYRADVHECIESFNLWSESVLAGARECAPLSCEEADACLDAAFSG